MDKNLTKLDFKDKRILFELDLNSRQSFTELAKKVGLSKQVVKYRVERLLGKKIIEEFITIWNIALLGYEQRNIYLRFKKTNLAKEKELINKLVKSKNTNWIVSTDGAWDLICATHFKTIQEFYDFLQKLIFEYGDIFRERKIYSITELLHFHRHYLIGKKPEKEELAFMVKMEGEVKTDELDRKIINELVYNSRMRTTEIAAKLYTTPETVNNRINNLRKQGVIQSFWIKMDWTKIGFQYYKIIIEFKNLTEKRKNELIGFCTMHPNILYIIEGIGLGDIHVDAELEGQEGLHELLGELRKNFNDIIGDFEVLTISKEHKSSYPLP